METDSPKEYDNENENIRPHPVASAAPPPPERAGGEGSFSEETDSAYGTATTMKIEEPARPRTATSSARRRASLL